MTTREPPLPRKVWIGTYEYELHLVEPTDTVLDDADGITLSEDGRKAVFISNSLGIRRRLEIVFHELTHAINWVNDVGQSDDDMVAMEEEELAEKYGLAWSAFLLDNPRFQRWLTYTLNKIRKERTDGA